MPELSLPSFPFTPQLGWSSTRSETFRICRRRYYYQYYAKHDREFSPSRIQQLRGLSSIPMLIGITAHDVLAVLLRRLVKTSTAIDRDRLWLYVGRTITEQLAWSPLMEVHYGQRPVPDHQELMAPVQSCLESFLASERFGWVRDHLQRDPAYLIEPPGYGEARLQGLKIYAKVDALVQDDAETLIFDWKTGRHDEARHANQVLGYAAWAEHNLNVPAESIRCLIAYLQPDYVEIEKRPTGGELQGFANAVADEIQQMQALCDNPERNIPMSKDAFPLTDTLTNCRHCKFRELCDRMEPGAST